ncbi:hypothetical protein TrRE_jg8357 [Triparma retinervis]|uniref:Helicase ATP-binding domain-containing protein n=1 Tax=Triparma retinervis TaxID=2557542 RepID=A0A9W7KTQ0_9STRA|nr:hypothetical protein TrRE_jg8357 [Triparma retinervis]
MATECQNEQIEALKSVIKDGHNHVSIQAPPGVGKTLVARMFLAEQGKDITALLLTKETAVVDQHQAELLATREVDKRRCLVVVRTHAWLDQFGLPSAATNADKYNLIIVDEGHAFDNILNKRREYLETILADGAVVVRQSALFVTDPKDKLYPPPCCIIPFERAVEEGRILDITIGLITATLEDFKKDDNEKEEFVDEEFVDEEFVDEEFVDEEFVDEEFVDEEFVDEDEGSSTPMRISSVLLVAELLLHSIVEPNEARFGDSCVGKLSFVFFNKICDAMRCYDAFVKKAGDAAAKIIFSGKSGGRAGDDVSIMELETNCAIRVVFAVGMYNEGVSVRRCSDVIVADPRFSTKNLYQLAGRAMRTAEGKESARLWLSPMYDADDADAIAPQLMSLLDSPMGDRVSKALEAAKKIAEEDEGGQEVGGAEQRQGRSAPTKDDRRNARNVIVASPPAIVLEGSVSSIELISRSLLIDRSTSSHQGTYALSFDAARTLVRAQKFASMKEFKQWKPKPPGMPTRPDKRYKDNGWESYPHFLGYTPLRNSSSLSFDAARTLARAQKLKSMKEFKQWKPKPPDMPSHPDAKYKNDGWKGYPDFLGYSLPFDEVRKLAQAQKLKSWVEFKQWKPKPRGMPSQPDKKYKNDGWKGYPDFLGYSLPFDEARKLAQAQKLKSRAAFLQWKPKPPGMPVHPEIKYKDNGWESWPTFLGY